MEGLKDSNKLKENDYEYSIYSKDTVYLTLFTFIIL
jgi:hypothetical protein